MSLSETCALHNTEIKAVQQQTKIFSFIQHNLQPANLYFAFVRANYYLLFFENRYNIRNFVINKRSMVEKRYEEYLIMKRSVEELISEHEKLRLEVADLKQALESAREGLKEKNEEYLQINEELKESNTTLQSNMVEIEKILVLVL